MSATRPKVKKPVDGRAVREAYQERKIARMVANGSTEIHARWVMDNARRERHNKRELRRITGLHIRQARGEVVE